MHDSSDHSVHLQDISGTCRPRCRYRRFLTGCHVFVLTIACACFIFWKVSTCFNKLFVLMRALKAVSQFLFPLFLHERGNCKLMLQLTFASDIMSNAPAWCVNDAQLTSTGGYGYTMVVNGRLDSYGRKWSEQLGCHTRARGADPFSVFTLSKPDSLSESLWIQRGLKPQFRQHWRTGNSRCDRNTTPCHGARFESWFLQHSIMYIQFSSCINFSF